METTRQVTLGGVRFSIEPNTGIQITPSTLERGRSYYQTICEWRTDEIAVQIQLGDTKTSGKQIFNGQDAWHLYQNDSTYELEVVDQPPLRARFSFPLDHVELSCQSDSSTLQTPFIYPLDQILTMYALASRQGILLHAAGAAIDGKALVFAGISGAGKTTLSRQLETHEDWVVLSDDRIIVRFVDGKWWAFGTPWPGDLGVARNLRFPLAGIYLLRQANDNRLTRCSTTELFEKLLPVASIPWFDKRVLESSLSICERITREVAGGELYFNVGSEVVDVLRPAA